MPDINPSLPVVGQPDSTEEPKVVTALSQLIAAVNDVDSAQIADGTITAADLATVIQEALYAPGDMKMTAHSTQDAGFLVCNGQAVSRADYAALFAKIGTTHGAGDGTTTFNVPNMVDRSPMGAGSTVAQGGATGEATHTLSQAEMPAHTHASVDIPAGGVIAFGSEGSGAINGAGGSFLIGTRIGFSTGSAGGNGAHNNLHPVRGVTFQIKT